MKNILKYLALFGILIIYPSSVKNIPVTIIKNEPIVHKKIKQSLRGDLAKFMSRLAKLESDNDSQAINRYGHMGKYQFDMSTLKSIGIETTQDEFLNNVALQDSALVLFLKDNKKSLTPVIRNFANTTYNGIFITKSGILAAAHFAGPIGVLSYFYPNDLRWSKGKTTDANGATISLYLEKFANYNLGI